MELETVVQDLLSRGQAEAAEVRRAAEAERERILREARAEGERIVSLRNQEAKETAERLRIQGIARAELESRKVVLSARKELLDEVYRTALERLGNHPESRDWLRTLLDRHASAWRQGKVSCNARDAEIVRPIVGENFGSTIDCVGGVVIDSADGSRRTDLRFETLLAEVWRDSIKEVAEVLWPPQ
jgi:V/A-type H+-transporting ATPase subunit E